MWRPCPPLAMYHNILGPLSPLMNALLGFLLQATPLFTTFGASHPHASLQPLSAEL